jgi:hypothetical protein
MGVGRKFHDPVNLPREKIGTHCKGGWVDLRAVLDGCGKSRFHRDSIPGQRKNGSETYLCFSRHYSLHLPLLAY